MRLNIGLEDEIRQRILNVILAIYSILLVAIINKMEMEDGRYRVSYELTCVRSSDYRDDNRESIAETSLKRDGK